MRNSLSTRAISVGNESVLSKSLVWAYFGEAYIDWGSECDSEDGIGAVIGQKVTVEEGVKIGYMNEKGGSAQPVMPSISTGASNGSIGTWKAIDYRRVYD